MFTFYCISTQKHIPEDLKEDYYCNLHDIANFHKVFSSAGEALDFLQKNSSSHDDCKNYVICEVSCEDDMIIKIITAVIGNINSLSSISIAISKMIWIKL